MVKNEISIVDNGKGLQRLSVFFDDVLNEIKQYGLNPVFYDTHPTSKNSYECILESINEESCGVITTLEMYAREFDVNNFTNELVKRNFALPILIRHRNREENIIANRVNYMDHDDEIFGSNEFNSFLTSSKRFYEMEKEKQKKKLQLIKVEKGANIDIKALEDLIFS